MNSSALLERARFIALLLPILAIFSAVQLACTAVAEDDTGAGGSAATEGVRGDDDAPGRRYGYGKP